MKSYEIDAIRNVALVGNGGCGKTSLGEALLFCAGATNRLGKVDEGSSVLDFEPEEKNRKLTISTSLAVADYKKHKLNFLDTPGYDVFLYDAEAAIQAVDTALFVVSAEPGGLKFETEKLWKICEEMSIPKAVFVTKLDKERASLDIALEGLAEMFDANFVPIQIPIGAEEEFKGYVDLIKMKAVTFSDDSGKGAEGDVPADLFDEAQAAREAMIENLVETDDELMEKFFDGQEITNDELRDALRAGIVSGLFVPVLLGSGTKNIGVTGLLDLIVSGFPTPAERVEVKCEEGEVTAGVDGPLAALVFKTIADPFSGKLSLCRVFQGKFKSEAPSWNATKETDERVSHLSAMVGKDVSGVESSPGDIVAIPKLKEAATGDCFTEKGSGIKLAHRKPPVPLMVFAAYAKAKGEEEKMSQGLRRMQEEDPTIVLTREVQTKEMLVGGVGRLHVDVVVERMRRKYNADVDLRTPKIPYRETIKGRTKVQGRHKKQSGGRGQFADTWIEIAPLPRSGGFKFNDKIVGGAIPRQYIPAVEAGIIERMGKGVLAGFPMVDVEVTLYDGKYHDVDSSEMAFKIAGSIGFKKGAAECKPVLLEPIYEVSVSVPEESMGDVIGDLNSRRGKVLGMDPQKNFQIIKAHVPLAEMQAYAPDLRSMTSGRGTFSMDFDHYDEVPAQAAEKIVAAHGVSDDEE